MTLIVISRLISQFSLYFMLSGYIASVAFELKSPPFIPFLITVAIAYGCYVLRSKTGKKLLSLLPLLGLGLCFGLFVHYGYSDDYWIGDLFCLVPPTVILISTVLRNNFVSSQGVFRSFFVKAFIIATVLCIASILYPGSLYAEQLTLPFMLTLLLSGILLMRTLRQDPSVYLKRRYQIVNGIIVAAGCTFGLILSTFLTTLLNILGVTGNAFTDLISVDLHDRYVTYNNLKNPKYQKPERTESIIEYFEHYNQWELDEEWLSSLGIKEPSLFIRKTFEDDDPTPKWLIILVAAAIIITLGAIVFVRRSRLKRRRQMPAWEKTSADEAAHAPTTDLRSILFPTNEQKVRRYFKKIVSCLTNDGVFVSPAWTSTEMFNALINNGYDPASSKKLHRLYIKARYDLQAVIGDDDVKTARELYIRLRHRKAKNVTKADAPSASPTNA